MRVAVIGAGISGLSIAHHLKEKYEVKIFERDSRPGGLVKCKKVGGALYHMVGGHVFNSKRQDVLNWFWQFFDRDVEFTKLLRNAIISMDNGSLMEYPIENNIYMLDTNIQKKIIQEWLTINQKSNVHVQNFEEFLKNRFGETLYHEYFRPYNEKIWRCDLKHVPLSWLSGKLPMPSVEEMLLNNLNHLQESSMVHSSFYYAKENGSQFLADRLSRDLDIVYNTEVCVIEKQNGKWCVNGYECDYLLFCGNIKDLPSFLKDKVDISSYINLINDLEYHGTTSVFCEIERNPYSWIYLPSSYYLAHRIICTGNFSSKNNVDGKTTGTVEFTDFISKEDIEENLVKMPFSPRYLDHTYTQYTYPVQNTETRKMVDSLKKTLSNNGIFLLGRFAEWEYYNMDAAIGAAIDLGKILMRKSL